MDCVLHQIALRDSESESIADAKQDLNFIFFAAIILPLLTEPIGPFFVPTIWVGALGSAILNHAADFCPDGDRDVLCAR